MLFVIGSIVEFQSNRQNYLIIYFLGGVVASLCSALWQAEQLSHIDFGGSIFYSQPIRVVNRVVSVGASGAIMSLLGAVLGVMIFRKLIDNMSEDEGVNNKKALYSILQIIVINLLLGYFIRGIDQAAHVGGLVTGFVIGSGIYSINSIYPKKSSLSGLFMAIPILALSALVLYGKLSDEFLLKLRTAYIDKYYPEKQRDPEEIQASINNERQMLTESFNAAMDDLRKIPDFIAKMKKMLKNGDLDIREFAFDMASYTTKLIIRCGNEKEYIQAQNLIVFYSENVYPKTGRDESSKVMDVASNALVIALNAENDQRSDVDIKKITELVFNILFGKNFDITATDNEILAYNLACFYAHQHAKPQMLVAARKAIQLGKKKDQFLADTDFKAYWTDSEFLSALSPVK